MRIVSLIASATEMVWALGFGEQLVGRSHECDYPEPVRRLPVCTEPKLNVNGSSREIDQSVKAILEQATSVYRVHADVLKDLRPDVIVTQSHCEVCAVSEKDVEQALCNWLDNRPRVVSLAPDDLDDVWRGVVEVAVALGAPKRGRALVESLQGRMQVIAAQASRLGDRPTVACLEWLDPLMAAGNWMPRLVEMAGGVNLFGEAGKHAPFMTMAELCARDPDYIIALPCGFDLERTIQEMPALERQPNWTDLRAVREGRVIATDGNQYFNRPGPRMVESLEILAEILHPDVFSFGHRGAGWCVRGD